MAKKIIDVNKVKRDGSFFMTFRSDRYDFDSFKKELDSLTTEDLLQIGIGIGYMIAMDDSADMVGLMEEVK